MNKEVLDVVTGIFQVTPEEAQKHSKPLDDLDATYFWQTARGGKAMIIKSNGEKLIASSAVSFEDHKKAFLDGRRN